MSDKHKQIDNEQIAQDMKHPAKVLYDMYIATDTLTDGEHTLTVGDMDKVKISGTTVTVYFNDDTTDTYTGDG